MIRRAVLAGTVFARWGNAGEVVGCIPGEGGGCRVQGLLERAAEGVWDECCCLAEGVGEGLEVLMPPPVGAARRRPPPDSCSTSLTRCLRAYGGRCVMLIVAYLQP